MAEMRAVTPPISANSPSRSRRPKSTVTPTMPDAKTGVLAKPSATRMTAPERPSEPLASPVTIGPAKTSAETTIAERSSTLVGAARSAGNQGSGVSPRATLAKNKPTKRTSTNTTNAASAATIKSGSALAKRSISCDAGMTTKPVKRCV